METVLRGVGIQLRDSQDEFRDFDEVLEDTASRWDTFSGVQQRAVAQAFAGTHHMNSFMVLMQNFDKALEYVNTAQNASGESMVKYEAYTDSLQGKLAGLDNAFQSLSNTTLSSDFMSGAVEQGTSFLNVITQIIDQIGILNTAAIGLGIIQGKNNSGESTWKSPCIFQMTYAA